MNFLENLWGIRRGAPKCVECSEKAPTLGRSPQQQHTDRCDARGGDPIQPSAGSSQDVVASQRSECLLGYTTIFESYFRKRHNKYKLPLVLSGRHEIFLSAPVEFKDF